jgi:hypothetical protein
MKLNLNDDALRAYPYLVRGGSLFGFGPDFVRLNPHLRHVEWVGLTSRQTGIRTIRRVV